MILHLRNVAYADVIRVMPRHVVSYVATWKDGFKMTRIIMVNGGEVFVTETPEQIDQKIYS